jgi:hypothetical protein
MTAWEPIQYAPSILPLSYGFNYGLTIGRDGTAQIAVQISYGTSRDIINRVAK